MKFLRLILLGCAAAVPVYIGMASTPAWGADRPVLRFGSTGSDVKKLQRRLDIPDDGAFGKQTLGKVLGLQVSKGLRPDGVVGSRTWRFVIRQYLPAEGTPFDGTGHRRAVLDKTNNVVYLIRSNGTVRRRAWTVDNDGITPAGGTTAQARVRTSLNIEESGVPGDLRLHYFVWINQTRGIGFHAIPQNPDGSQIHPASALGAGTPYASHGCVRLSYGTARFLYNWLPNGAGVNVVESL